MLDGRLVISRRSTGLNGSGRSLSIDRLGDPANRAAEADPSVEFDVVRQTTRSWWWTSRRDWSSIRGPAIATGTLVNGLVARYPELVELTEEPGRTRPSRDRAPFRPGDVGVAGRGPDGACISVTGRPDPCRSAGSPGLPGARVGHGGGDSGVVEAPIGRSVPRPPGWRSHRGKRGADPLSVEGRIRRSRADHALGGQAGDGANPPDPGPSRRPSAIRWWATDVYGSAGRRCPTPARSVRSCTLVAGVRPPDARGTGCRGT